MGVEYGLYHRESKQFVWLGKRRHFEPLEFQLPATRITAFLAEVAAEGGELLLAADTGNLPDEDDPSWVCRDRWHWSHADEGDPPGSGEVEVPAAAS